MKRIQNNRRSAFTLIELLLVMVILVVLASIVLPRFTGQSKHSKEVAAKTDISSISTALNMFEVKTGRFPTDDEGLQALIAAPSGLETSWDGPYLQKGVPNDPWGKPYIYKCPGTHDANGFDLYSLGADGREGTDDIVSWQ